jgi:hypothetical protein
MRDVRCTRKVQFLIKSGAIARARSSSGRSRVFFQGSGLHPHTRSASIRRDRNNKNSVSACLDFGQLLWVPLMERTPNFGSGWSGVYETSQGRLLLSMTPTCVCYTCGPLGGPTVSPGTESFEKAAGDIKCIVLL